MLGLLAKLFELLIKFALALLFYATPLVGFWLASSLAAYLGGPRYLPWLAGAFLFPIIPGLWELHAWSHRNKDKKAWLTPLDRISLRTFVVGVLFIGALLYTYPQAAFIALSTRGDWMLDDLKDSRVPAVRKALFTAAGGLEWLYKTTKTNPYKNCIDPKARELAEEASQERAQEIASVEKSESASNGTNSKQNGAGTQQADEGGDGSSGDSAPPPEFEVVLPQLAWPWQNSQSLHPVVASMPASAEASIKSVAQYIAKREKDPVQRIKALHDYVADRVGYDADAYYSGNIPDQDAETTFRTRKSVCAGYANLLSALGDAIDEKIIVVTGDARDEKGGKLSGEGHAWNAARIGKKWYLIDACWDSGFTSREKGFRKAYRTDYLLPPPVVMIQDHFPEDSDWQLLDKPLTQGDFLRQPMLRPRFVASDLALVSPARACNETESKATVVLKNPRRLWLSAGLEQDGTRLELDLPSTNEETAQLQCSLPGKGTYRFNIFESKKEYGSYDFVGSIDFVNR